MGKTWTTNAPYRETRSQILARRAQECLTVEMETTAFSRSPNIERCGLGHLSAQLGLQRRGVVGALLYNRFMSTAAVWQGSDTELLTELAALETRLHTTCVGDPDPAAITDSSTIPTGEST